VRHRQFFFLDTLLQREHATRYSCLSESGHIHILVIQSFLFLLSFSVCVDNCLPLNKL
jgi:hypothetical protein